MNNNLYLEIEQTELLLTITSGNRRYYETKFLKNKVMQLENRLITDNFFVLIQLNSEGKINGMVEIFEDPCTNDMKITNKWGKSNLIKKDCIYKMIIN